MKNKQEEKKSAGTNVAIIKRTVNATYKKIK